MRAAGLAAFLTVAVAAASSGVAGDQDGDTDVDVDDVQLILAARGMPATGPGDPRDIDGDGVITVLDARIAAASCTRPLCATGNNPPAIVSPANVSAPENQTTATDVDSIDPDGVDTEGAGLTYALTGGADQDKLSIDADTGILSFTSTPNFESPADADADNIYEVQVTVIDSGGLSTSQDLQVTVLDVNEAPIITSPATVSAEENQTTATDVDSTDPDGVDVEGAGLTYSLAGGADQGSFSIDADTGILSFTVAPNFESPADADADNLYEVQVTVIDSGGLSTIQDLQVTVTDVIIEGVGTWNARLYPWRDPAALGEVIDTIPRGLSVLALQEVFREDDAQAIASELASDYPYSYVVPALDVPTVSCRSDNVEFCPLLDMDPDCGTQFASAILAAFVTEGVPEEPTQLLPESIPSSSVTSLYLLFLLLVDGNCYSCLQSVLHGLDPNASTSTLTEQTFAQCIAPGDGGPAYSFDGSPGLMLLSKSPIEDVATHALATWLRTYVVATAQIDGLTYAFTQWPVDFQIPPGFDRVDQYQLDFAALAISLEPDVIVGDLSSGESFQPDAYQALLEAGYVDATENFDTWCPLTMGDHPGCRPLASPGAVTIPPDDPADTSKVMLRDATGDWILGSPMLFNEQGTDSTGEPTLSPHAGVAVEISLP